MSVSSKPGTHCIKLLREKTLVILTGVFFPTVKSMEKLCLPEFSDFT